MRSARFADLEELIVAGWGDVPQTKIPPDWRNRKPPRTMEPAEWRRRHKRTRKPLDPLAETVLRNQGRARRSNYVEDFAAEHQQKIRQAIEHAKILAHRREEYLKETGRTEPLSA